MTRNHTPLDHHRIRRYHRHKNPSYVIAGLISVLTLSVMLFATSHFVAQVMAR